MITPYSDDMTFAERLLNFKTEMDLAQDLREWDRKFGKVFSDKYPGFPGIRQIYDVSSNKILKCNLLLPSTTKKLVASSFSFIQNAVLPKKISAQVAQQRGL